jgi:hypothetical protein
MDSIEREQIDKEYNQLSSVDKFFSHPVYIFCLITFMCIDLYIFINGSIIGIICYAMILPGLISVVRDGSLRKSIKYYFY